LENKTEHLFFEYLRDALWRNDENLPGELSDKEMTELLSLAEQQTVLGLVMDSLTRHHVKMSKQWVFKAIALIEQVKQQGLRVSHGICDLHVVFANSGVDYVVVKGQIVASYYPEPLLRQAGDIDYYCDCKNFPLSQETIKQTWGIVGEKESSEKHVHFERKGVVYEGHFDLLDLYSTPRNAYWQRLLDNDGKAKVNIGDEFAFTLSPTLHVLYVFLHLYHHLLALGVGLRQFCDLAVMLHYAKDQIDMNALRKHLDELGMEKAWRACGCLLIDYLGLPEEELGYSLYSADRKYGKKILDVVLYRGNMGHYNKRGGFSGWKHKLEAVGIKLSHFFKFMPLAPSYTCGWLWHEVKRSL